MTSKTYLLSVIPLDRAAPIPLHRQVYDGLRRAILAGQLAAGAKLPSTRDLAQLLSLSRNTVLNAVDQLIAEGYVIARPGSGTYVTSQLPDAPFVRDSVLKHTERPVTLSRAAEAYRVIGAMMRNAPPPQNVPFMVGVPDVEAFPFDLWARLVADYYRSTPPHSINAGWRATLRLRTRLAEYLRASRAVRCDPEQVVIVSGSQQGIALAVRVLLNAGDRAWIEDPGYLEAHNVLRAEGIERVPVPVDSAGLDVDAGIAHAPDARLVYVTPSHQFPTGVTMTLARRLKLLAWAESAQAWVLEDDYDSEYRLEGHPLSSLQGLDAHDRVIYIGTFSKVLFPGLRLAYLVVPPDLVDAFVGAAAVSARSIPAGIPDALASFIERGHFARHIRRMRKRYADKRDVLVEASIREANDLLELGASESGLHLVAWLCAPLSDLDASRRARTAGVAAVPVSRLSVGDAPRPGLVLGYGSLSHDAIRDGMRRLASALRSGTPPSH
jgi:GntR family transcriptional regulator/MocR family aminotransferase